MGCDYACCVSARAARAMGSPSAIWPAEIGLLLVVAMMFRCMCAFLRLRVPNNCAIAFLEVVCSFDRFEIDSFALSLSVSVPTLCSKHTNE